MIFDELFFFHDRFCRFAVEKSSFLNLTEAFWSTLREFQQPLFCKDQGLCQQDILQAVKVKDRSEVSCWKVLQTSPQTEIVTDKIQVRIRLNQPGEAK